ncbi:hypothetical protein RYZ20_07995 [Thioclava sp. A2]|uniref:hypothetical protein n=1 Tax=Thioclava sp. FCG-A2 TaxID=3080562 RepID=UPI0029537AA5|nr:hypothetical protein [Thioclava sp. A2]MDV7270842.1 hypothetical protein [Thioclava sp. A2]
MAEFERKGHWRTLLDGTRTWVAPHVVSRDSQPASEVFPTHVLERRLEEIKAKVEKRKAKKARRKAQLRSKREARKARIKSN